jgi:TonB family protein
MIGIVSGVGTGAVRQRSDNVRWVKSVFLALCLDAAGLALVGSLMPGQQVPGLEPALPTLRVQLGAGLKNKSVPMVAQSTVAHPTPAIPLAPVSDPIPVPLPVPMVASSPETAQPARAGIDDMVPAPDPTASTANHAAGSIAGFAPGAAAGLDRVTAVSELLRRIDAIVRERLVYPPLARKRNIEGIVQMLLVVGEDGRLIDSTLAQGSGSSILDKAANSLVEAVFPLALDEPMQEPARLRISVAYSLND